MVVLAELISDTKIQQHVSLFESIIGISRELQSLLEEIDGFSEVPLIEVKNAVTVSNSRSSLSRVRFHCHCHALVQVGQSTQVITLVAIALAYIQRLSMNL